MARKKVAKKAKKVISSTHGRAPGKTQISISLSESLVKGIDKLAAVENRNRSNYISNVLLEKVEGK